MLGNALYDAYLKGELREACCGGCFWFIWKSRAEPKKLSGNRGESSRPRQETPRLGNQINQYFRFADL